MTGGVVSSGRSASVVADRSPSIDLTEASFLHVHSLENDTLIARNISQTSGCYYVILRLKSLG
jgi:hypothetical protein